MLCWLYFGKSFERMVERCEELRRSPDLGFLQKMTMSATIKLLISSSIKLELRTKQDRDTHLAAMRLAESDRVLEWASDSLTVEDAGEKRKPGRPNTTRSLVEMVSPTVSHPDELRRKIGEYLTKKHTQTDIARLKIALDELHYQVVPTNIKPFRDALQAECGSDIRIVHERGIQEVYSRLTEPLLIGSTVSSRGGEALVIREIKNFLSQ